MMPFQKAFLNSPEIGRHLEIAGCTLHYHEQGEGAALILLHGLGFSLYTFRRIIPDLSDHYRVISLDLPGCGYSKGIPGDGSVEAMSGAIHGFIDAVCHDQPVSLLGIAEGAIYAMDLCEKHPQAVTALILESPGSLTRYYPWQWQHLITPVLGDWLMRRLTEKDFEQALRWLHFDETTIHEYEVHQFIQPFREPEVSRNALELLRSFDNRGVFHRIRDIRCPVCLLWGDNDPCHPVSMSTLYTRAIDDCRFRVLRNCGHLAHEERPAEFVEAVHGFLSSSLPRRWTGD